MGKAEYSQEFMEKHRYLEKKLKIKGVTFNYHDSFTSVCEAVLARGDRRVGKAIALAHAYGCRLDGWTEHFYPEKWKKALNESGATPEFYAFRERHQDEVLPWDQYKLWSQQELSRSRTRKEL